MWDLHIDYMLLKYDTDFIEFKAYDIIYTGA